MQSWGSLLPFTFGLLSSVTAMETSIFIDQISAYSNLPDCAENKLSAVVRAQASGCGDNQQLTSFSCFCIEQSTRMVSIISTAVQENCAAKTTGTETITSPLPQVTSALDVFNSYCARSTELAQYPNTVTRQSQVTITAVPSSTSSLASATSTPTSNSDPSSGVPVAAIAAPVVIGIFAITAVICLLLWLRRRRAANGFRTGSSSGDAIHYNPSSYTSGVARGYEHDDQRYELGVHTPAAEVGSDIAKYRHELEDKETTEPVELEGGDVKGGVKLDVKGNTVKSEASEWLREKK